MTRPRAHTIGLRHEYRIINTLLELKKRGLAESTLKTTSQKLNQLAGHADLMNPQEVLTYIANTTISNSAEQKLENCYDYFTKMNNKACLDQLQRGMH